MTHEPECHANAIVDSDGLVIPDTYRRYLTGAMCTCEQLRAAYQRGRAYEFDQAQQHAEDEYKRGVAVNADAIQRVRELHFAEPDDDGDDYCHQDGLFYPCPTIEALDGNHE